MQLPTNSHIAGVPSSATAPRLVAAVVSKTRCAMISSAAGGGEDLLAEKGGRKLEVGSALLPPCTFVDAAVIMMQEPAQCSSTRHASSTATGNAMINKIFRQP